MTKEKQPDPGDYVQLASISDPMEAELLAVFLDNHGLEFGMTDRHSAPVLGGLTPQVQRPVSFLVPANRLEQGRSLLEEYERLQAREAVPSEFPPPYEQGGKPKEGDLSGEKSSDKPESDD
ncbi:MAG: DUF2007 domain-containing protein [Polyangia bacterium]